MGNVQILDNNDIPISEEIFPVLVLQYLYCSSFGIKLCIKSDPNEPFLVQVSLILSIDSSRFKQFN